MGLVELLVDIGQHVTEVVERRRVVGVFLEKLAKFLLRIVIALGALKDRAEGEQRRKSLLIGLSRVGGLLDGRDRIVVALTLFIYVREREQGAAIVRFTPEDLLQQPAALPPVARLRKKT